ncbi:MAG: phosphatidylserine decarboxylase family protein [Thermodesulfobacteriota bacterium]
MKKIEIPVAKEGVPFIFLAAFVTLIAAILELIIVAGVGLCLTAFILYFFRDPERVAPEDDDALVAPADGKVILVEKVFDDRFVGEHVLKVSIFMNVFNVHVNRMPFPGTVKSITYKAGRFYAADKDRAALENECCTVTMVTKNDLTYAVSQVAGLVARRIVCWAERGDEFGKGQRFGLIRFGSRVDLYLPLQTHLEIQVGQKTRAGETVLGYLNS